MEDRLQTIRNQHPELNPTETYNLLSKALTSDVAEEHIDYDSLENALVQLEEMVRRQGFATHASARPSSAEDLLRPGYQEWFGHLERDHKDSRELFDKIQNIMYGLPDKDRIATMVDAMII